MADSAEHGPATGRMDLKENRRTWRGFLSVIKWSVGSALLLLLIMAIFRTH